MHRLKQFAPWLLLGPITGPLAEGVYRNLRKGETLLACLYAFAIPITWFDPPALFRMVVIH